MTAHKFGGLTSTSNIQHILVSDIIIGGSDDYDISCLFLCKKVSDQVVPVRNMTLTDMSWLATRTADPSRLGHRQIGGCSVDVEVNGAEGVDSLRQLIWRFRNNGVWRILGGLLCGG
jgi:hypothetical protein